MRATPTTIPRYALMKNNYRRRLELHTLEVLQTPSVGEVCEYPQSKFFSQFISCLGIGVCSRILLYKKKKKMGGIAMVTTLSLHQQDTMVSALNVLLLMLNKALPGGRPRIARFVLIPISLWIKLNHASCFLYLLLYAPVWMCSMQHIHRLFKLSVVLKLKKSSSVKPTWCQVWLMFLEFMLEKTLVVYAD